MILQYYELYTLHLLQLFSYLGNVFLTRCILWSTWFRCIFYGLYTRIKCVLPPCNCVIRHTRRSIISSNFSHQLFQWTAKFWASIDVSQYFILFVDTFINHFYYCNSCQWQMANFISYIDCNMYIYIPLCRYCATVYRYVWVYIVANVDIEIPKNKQLFSNMPRIYKLCAHCLNWFFSSVLSTWNVLHITYTKLNVEDIFN